MNDIMAISRLRMGTDGKGISTLVAFYGCPLNCAYCLNPQCKMENALRVEYTPEELLNVVKVDDIYFQMTGGGIVFGGGEPLCASEFIRSFCRIANPKWKIRIETSLNVPWKQIELLIPYVDDWIIDIKDMNSEIYYTYTGMRNEQVLENLKRLKELVSKEKVRIRVPLIPDYNTEEDVEKSLEKLNDFENLEHLTYVV